MNATSRTSMNATSRTSMNATGRTSMNATGRTSMNATGRTAMNARTQPAEPQERNRQNLNERNRQNHVSLSFPISPRLCLPFLHLLPRILMTVRNVVLQDLVVPAELPYRKNTPSKPHVAMRGYYEGEWLPNISFSLVAILTLSVREGALRVRVRASFSSVV